MRKQTFDITTKQVDERMWVGRRTCGHDVDTLRFWVKLKRGPSKLGRGFYL